MVVKKYSKKNKASKSIVKTMQKGGGVWQIIKGQLQNLL